MRTVELIEFDVTNEADFRRVARNFGRALPLFEAEARKEIPYCGQILYHPFLIAVEGPPAGGKSTFIEQAALAYAEEAGKRGLQLIDPLKPLKKMWPDSEGKRDIKIWMRWPFADEAGNGFEIRSDDRIAVDSLYGQYADISLPTIEIPHIWFREWPDENFLENCRAATDITYTGKRRLLKISIDPALEVDKILGILTQPSEATRAPCLTSSTTIANELVPAF